MAKETADGYVVRDKDGKTVFIPKVKPGETVTVKHNGGSKNKGPIYVKKDNKALDNKAPDGDEMDWRPWAYTGGGGLAGYLLAKALFDDDDRNKSWVSKLLPYVAGGIGALGGYAMSKHASDSDFAAAARAAGYDANDVERVATVNNGQVEDVNKPGWGRTIGELGGGAAVGTLGIGRAVLKARANNIMDATENMAALRSETTLGKIQAAYDAALKEQISATKAFSRANPSSKRSASKRSAMKNRVSRANARVTDLKTQLDKAERAVQNLPESYRNAKSPITGDIPAGVVRSWEKAVVRGNPTSGTGFLKNRLTRMANSLGKPLWKGFAGRSVALPALLGTAATTIGTALGAHDAYRNVTTPGDIKDALEAADYTVEQSGN